MSQLLRPFIQLQGLTTRDGRALTLEDDLTAPISEDVRLLNIMKLSD